MPSDDTTTAPETGDGTNAQENWQERYTGLQRTVAKRDERLNTVTTELDALRAQHEAATAELTTFRERDAAANAEATELAEYERLKAIHEAPPPKPVATNPAAGSDWTAPEGSKYAERERTGTSSGWPT